MVAVVTGEDDSSGPRGWFQRETGRFWWWLVVRIEARWRHDADREEEMRRREGDVR